MGERFCSNCGNRISGEGKFCPFCGAVVAMTPAEEIGATVAVPVEEPVYQVNPQPVPEEVVYQQPQVTYQQPVYQQPVYQQHQQPAGYQTAYATPVQHVAQQPVQPAKPKKKTGLIVGLTLVGVVAVVLIAAVLVFALTPSDSNTGIFENICKGNLLGGGSGIEHSYSKATCEEPETCEYCEATKGKAKGHDWIDATCTEPKTCDICGTKKGEALGHTWIDATYTDAQMCNSCGAIGEPSITVQKICGDWNVVAYTLGDGVQSAEGFGYTLKINEDGTGRLDYSDDALIFDWEFYNSDEEDILCTAVVSNRNDAVVMFGWLSDESEETYDHILFIVSDSLTLLFERA